MSDHGHQSKKRQFDTTKRNDQSDLNAEHFFLQAQRSFIRGMSMSDLDYQLFEEEALLGEEVDDGRGGNNVQEAGDKRRTGIAQTALHAGA